MFRIIVLFLGLMAVGLNADELFQFETDEQRKQYIKLTEELRCPKCQNQNLSDSNSEISEVMRDIVAEQTVAGKSEDHIKAMMVDRYGDFVLYEPPVNSGTLMLWWAPLIMLVLAGTVFLAIILRRNKQSNSGAADNEAADESQNI